MLFKRFSRSRSNSQSYVDPYQSPHDSKTDSASYDDARYSTTDRYGAPPMSAGSGAQHYDDRRDLPSSIQSNNAPLMSFGDSGGKETTVDNMYPRQSQPTEVPNMQSSYNSPRTNGYGGGDGYEVHPPSRKEQPAADLLMQAFNQALKPHMDKVDQMEAEIADLRGYISQLEQQQSDVHAWIDKRGLRPGMLHAKLSFLTDTF